MRRPPAGRAIQCFVEAYHCLCLLINDGKQVRPAKPCRRGPQGRRPKRQPCPVRPGNGSFLSTRSRACCRFATVPVSTRSPHGLHIKSIRRLVKIRRSSCVPVVRIQVVRQRRRPWGRQTTLNTAANDSRTPHSCPVSRRWKLQALASSSSEGTFHVDTLPDTTNSPVN